MEVPVNTIVKICCNSQLYTGTWDNLVRRRWVGGERDMWCCPAAKESGVSAWMTRPGYAAGYVDPVM
jgi:hypothetical protein